jgi:hypothetical protein
MRWRFALLVAAPLLVGAVALGALTGRIYRNPALRIYQLELPRDWQAVPLAQIAYPRVLLVATAKSNSARLTVAAQRVLPGTGAELLAADARAALLRQGWEDPRVTSDGEKAGIDASRDRGKRLLRQAYVVNGDMAYVFTVVTPFAQDRKKDTDRVLRDFDGMLGSLQLLPYGTAADNTAPPSDGGVPSDGGAP